LESAVHLVGRRVDEDGRRTAAPHGFEHVEGSERVALEVRARIRDGCRDGYLAGEMTENRRRLGERGLQLPGLTHVAAGKGELGRPGLLAQPGEVRVRSVSRQIVEDHDAITTYEIVRRQVGSDESAPARDEDRHASEEITVAAGCQPACTPHVPT